MYVFLGAEVVKQLHYSPGGYSTKYVGRLCPEVHPLTISYTCTIFDRKGSSFVYAPLKNGTS